MVITTSEGYHELITFIPRVHWVMFSTLELEWCEFIAFLPLFRKLLDGCTNIYGRVKWFILCKVLGFTLPFPGQAESPAEGHCD